MKLKPGVVREIPIGLLEPDPQQPRKNFDERFLDALGDSLKHGFDHPLLVREQGRKIIIVDGEQRWRAAKKKGIKKVPCLPAVNNSPMEVATVQLRTSALRCSLRPMEIAEFLWALRERENKSMNELIAALDQRGITNIGQARLERFFKFIELPVWLKNYLRDGTFTEAHGQQLLHVLGFPTVIEALKPQLTQEVKWKGGLTVRELTRCLEGAFRQAGINLNRDHGLEHEIRAFPIEPCRKCEFYKKIGGSEFCLNAQEFQRKQDAALILKTQKPISRIGKTIDTNPDYEIDPAKVAPRRIKVSSDNIVPLRRMDHRKYEALGTRAQFDQTQCQTCPHRHLASEDGSAAGAIDHCFHTPCFHEKTRQGRRNESRKEKLRENLASFLRPLVKSNVHTLSQRDLLNIVLWMATGAIDQFSPHYAGQMHDAAAKIGAVWLSRTPVRSLPDLMDIDFKPDIVALCELAVEGVMTREQVRWLSARMKIGLSPPNAYRINADYLKLKRKGDLIELARIGCLQTVADLDIEQLRAVLLQPQAIELIGIPADILELYFEPYNVPVADDPLDLIEEDSALDPSATEQLESHGDEIAKAAQEAS